MKTKKKKMTLKKWYPQYGFWKRQAVWRNYLFSGYCANFSLDAFLYYQMDKMTAAQRKEIVPDRELQQYDKALNDEEGSRLFNSKYAFYQIFGDVMQRGICFPAYEKKEDFLKFVKKYPRFVMKPDDAYGGKGFLRFELSEGETWEESFLEELYAKARENRYVAEEWLEAHDKYREIYPGAFCTIRVNTLLDNTGKVTVFAAANQFGSGGSIIDNDEEDGIWAAIAIDTGRVFAVEKDADTAVEYRTHPDTGKDILGFENVKWQEAKELVCRMAKRVPQCRWIGWDVGILADGSVELMEGNVTPEIGVWQAMTGTGVRSVLDSAIEK